MPPVSFPDVPTVRAPVTVNDDREPDVAVMAPVMVALFAVNAPAGVTLNGAEPNVAWPRYIPFESALNILFPEPIDIVPPESAPVNVPLAADKAPVNVPPPLMVSAVPFQDSLSFKLNLPALST